jgi:organic radical activating enzyme
VPVLRVKEVFATMQGEGSRAGTPCVFVRLSGCNLWAGTQSTRLAGRGACAAWCDTDFHGGDQVDVVALVDDVLRLTDGWAQPAVVVSGGEPMLQLRRPAGEALVAGLQGQGVHVAVETNGTVAADVLAQLDHVTVSPKALGQRRAVAPVDLDHVLVRTGTDLKVVVPQWSVVALATMARWDFTHRYLQPLDDGDPARYVGACLHLAQRDGWRVSVQTHKLVGLP